MNRRTLHLSAPADDDCETLYTITADSPDGPAVLGIIVDSNGMAALIDWPDGEQNRWLANVRLPEPEALTWESAGTVATSKLRPGGSWQIEPHNGAWSLTFVAHDYEIFITTYDSEDAAKAEALDLEANGIDPLACIECYGKGYLLDQEYGTANIPDGWRPVQRCDACSEHVGDGEAAAKAARDLDATAYAYFFAEHDDDPGDYAIQTKEKPVIEIIERAK